MADITLAPPATYALGHSADELDRLVDQGQFFGDLTAQLLRGAGLGVGMRVLDIGCGAGDVSFLAASMVGPSGSVLGVDRSPEAINLATRRAVAAGLTNVRFLVHDLVDLELAAPVDAVIGRLVLMYLTDPAVVLRRLAGNLKPGGIVVAQEMDIDGATSEPHCQLFEGAVRRIIQTFAAIGADPRTGLKLGRIFREAGLSTPRMILGARVEEGPDSPIYDQVTQVTRSLLPVMERTGVASAKEVSVDSLADRLRAEAAVLGATLVSPLMIGAWARTASAPGSLA
jgi:SAM-dependent methyltransferase